MIQRHKNIQFFVDTVWTFVTELSNLLSYLSYFLLTHNKSAHSHYSHKWKKAHRAVHWGQVFEALQTKSYHPNNALWLFFLHPKLSQVSACRLQQNEVTTATLNKMRSHVGSLNAAQEAFCLFIREHCWGSYCGAAIGINSKAVSSSDLSLSIMEEAQCSGKL